MYWLPSIDYHLHLQPGPLKNFDCPISILNSLCLKLRALPPVGFSSSVNDHQFHMQEPGPVLHLPHRISYQVLLIYPLFLQPSHLLTSIISTASILVRLSFKGLSHPSPWLHTWPCPCHWNIHPETNLIFLKIESVHITSLLKHFKDSTLRL